MDLDENVWASRQRMLPYSIDPELSRQRHQDPTCINSSDMSEYPYSESLASSTGVPLATSPLPSSPPKSDTDAEVDEPTDDDDDDEEAANSANAGYTAFVDANTTLWARRALSGSTLKHGSFSLAARAESSSRLTPEKLISSVFDDENFTDINLEGRGVKSVPDAFRDLVDHEDLGSRLFKMNLCQNSIKRLNGFIYNITRLEYLSLRWNQIEELSPLIGQLIMLQELHLENNELRTLPAELLDLPRLRALVVYPNNFIEPPEDGEREKLVILNPVPSLVELSRRKIANMGNVQHYIEFERVITQLIQQFPHISLSRLLGSVLDTIYVGRICSICRLPVIEPMAVHLNWRRHRARGVNSEVIPFQTVLCSPKCLSLMIRRD